MDVLKRLLRAVLLAAIAGALAPGVVTAQETIEPDIKATFLYTSPVSSNGRVSRRRALRRFAFV